MSDMMPDYLSVPPEKLGAGTSVKVTIIGDMDDVARHFARALFDEIKAKPNVTMILPVGPVDQFVILAQMINDAKLDCRDVLIINMDEYLTDDDQWIAYDHPLCFRGFVDRNFYNLIDPDLAPREENRICPHPRKLGQIQELIDRRGGLDACYGGIGINGHIAFNEPPEPDEQVSNEDYAARPTRVLSTTRETRTINANTVGGEIAVIPRRAVTVGMKEILSAERLRFYSNRPWQSAVVRRVLHGPVTPRCPGSFLQTHDDASITVAEYVGAIPDIRLR